MLFDAHAHAFEAFGGVPQRGIYDNTMTAMDKFLSGKKRKINHRFGLVCGVLNQNVAADAKPASYQSVTVQRD